MKSDDLVPFLTAQPPNEIGFRQGEVRGWVPETGENTIRIGGQDFTDLPVLAASSVAIAVGDLVAILRVGSTYFVLGVIRNAGSGSLATRAAYLTSFSESLLSTSFVDLPTPGPSVDAYIGASRQAIVFITCNMVTIANYGYMGVQVSGASNIAASPFLSAYSGNEDTGGDVAVSASATTLLTAADGLNEGLNTFTAKYRTQFATGTTVDFANRRLVVMPF